MADRSDTREALRSRAEIAEIALEDVRAERDRLVAERATLNARNETALQLLKDNAGWDSSRPFTQDEARKYHVANIMAISFLEGNHDEAAAKARAALVSGEDA
jgi:hypothetical protein